METAARARLGLPLELADDEFAGVEERLSPPPSLRAALEDLPPHERRGGAMTDLPPTLRRYEKLPVSAQTRRLLSIAAQHRGAPVVRDAAAYREAIAMLFPNG